MAKLYVGNLSFEVTDDGLQQLFAGRGFKVESARVIRDMNSGQSRGFGFVELAAGEDQARAIAELNGFTLEGRAIIVNEARPQAPRGGRGGGFGGDRGGRGGRGDRGGRGRY
jgi:RNA recognition motif-containing protein